MKYYFKKVLLSHWSITTEGIITATQLNRGDKGVLVKLLYEGDPVEAEKRNLIYDILI